MKALSIKQPWAWAIFNKGKDIENRTWQTNQRGTVLIHVSKTSAENAPPELFKEWQKANLEGDESAAMGGIIGQVDIVDCVQHHDSEWKFSHCFGFVLKNAKKLPFKKMNGQMGFFDVAD